MQEGEWDSEYEVIQLSGWDGVRGVGNRTERADEGPTEGNLILRTFAVFSNCSQKLQGMPGATRHHSRIIPGSPHPLTCKIVLI